MEAVYNVRADLDRAADAIALLPRRKPDDLAEHKWWFDQFCVPEHGVPVEVCCALVRRSVTDFGIIDSESDQRARHRCRA